MAATYINGNSFKVNFVLWKRDITSYFRHTYFYPSLHSLWQSQSNHFVHSLGFAFFVTLAVAFTSRYLGLQNQLLLLAYFPVLVILSIWNHYRKTVTTAAPIVGKHYIVELNPGFLRIKETEGSMETVLAPTDVSEVVEKEDMVIVYTKDDSYFIPTRVLNDGHIESLLAFCQ